MTHSQSRTLPINIDHVEEIKRHVIVFTFNFISSSYKTVDTP